MSKMGNKSVIFMIGTILQAFTNEVIIGAKKIGKFTDTQLEEEKTNEDAHCATFQVENQVTLNEKKNKRRGIAEILNKRKSFKNDNYMRKAKQDYQYSK